MSEVIIVMVLVMLFVRVFKIYLRLSIIKDGFSFFLMFIFIEFNYINILLMVELVVLRNSNDFVDIKLGFI